MSIESLNWHPLMQALAISWQDGTMTLWNEDERLTREEKTVHSSVFKNIPFSTDDSKMVIGDLKSTCVMLRTHKRMFAVC